MNTLFEYLYRDASNYKVFSRFILSGTLSEAQVSDIKGKLNDGENFIPSKVGLPENRFASWTEDDHDWFELIDISETSRPVDFNAFTAQQLYDRFMAVQSWEDPEQPQESPAHIQVQTPEGVLIARTRNDNEYPGIEIALRRPGHDRDEVIALVEHIPGGECAADDDGNGTVCTLIPRCRKKANDPGFLNSGLMVRTWQPDEDEYCARVALEGIHGTRRLRAEDISFTGDISELDHELNFYMEVWFNADEVFGTNVNSTENDDWINVYAKYDLRKKAVCDDLDIILVKGNGVEEELTYHLDQQEIQLLLEKMERYCQQANQKSLADMAREWEDATPPFLRVSPF